MAVAGALVEFALLLAVLLRKGRDTLANAMLACCEIRFAGSYLRRYLLAKCALRRCGCDSDSPRAASERYAK